MIICLQIDFFSFQTYQKLCVNRNTSCSNLIAKILKLDASQNFKGAFKRACICKFRNDKKMISVEPRGGGGGGALPGKQCTDA